MFVKCQSSFCEDMIQMYKKITKMESSMVVKSFTLLNKKKEEIEKRILLQLLHGAALWLCLYLLVFLLMSLLSRDLEVAQSVCKAIWRPIQMKIHSKHSSGWEEVGCTPPSCLFLCWHEGRSWGRQGLDCVFVLASLPRGLLQHSTAKHPTGLHLWFYWTASPGMHYWLVNEDDE